MSKIEIALVNPLNRIENEYSIECGTPDNHKHFNHHGTDDPSPCNNRDIIPINDIAMIQISHLDADTLIGLMRLMGETLPTGLDYALMERIDTNGSTGIPVCDTLAFMVAVGDWGFKHRFPRCPSADVGFIDVTGYINELIHDCSPEHTNDQAFLAEGYASIAKSEANYKAAEVAVTGNVGLYHVKEGMKFNPSRPYEDGIDIVVVYREQYESISIYCSPTNDFAFGGTTVADIEFVGHAKACGSPRGVSFTLEDANNVAMSCKARC